MSKTMIITGASRGIGAALARAAAEHGMNLVLNARSEGPLKTLAASLGVDAAAVVAGDASQQSTCQQIVDCALDRFGGVDVLVNNAGILPPIGTLDQVSGEEWATNLRVNVMGPVLLSQAAIAPLRRTGGKILNVSSGAAVKAIRGWSAYCTSKAALNHFNRMLAAEFPEVTSIAISPGMTATDMQVMIRDEGQGRMPEQEHARFVEAHDRGELRSVESVASDLLLIARNASKDWSGEFLTLDDPRVRSLAKTG